MVVIRKLAVIKASSELVYRGMPGLRAGYAEKLFFKVPLPTMCSIPLPIQLSVGRFLGWKLNLNQEGDVITLIWKCPIFEKNYLFLWVLPDGELRLVPLEVCFAFN